jgi:predicted peptidase
MGERGNGTTEIWNVAKIGPAKEIKNGSNMTFEVNGQKHSFVVIVPQLATDKNEWKSETIDHVVEFVKQKYRIDESRIYLTGLSLGGGGAWNYASEYGYKIAALAPVCGAAWPNTTRANNIAMHQIPVWAFHGLKDTTVPPASSRNWVSLINDKTTAEPARLTEYEDVGHAAWNRAYATDHSYHEVNLYEWLLSHSRKATSVTSAMQSNNSSTAKTLHITNDILPDLE